MGWGPHVNIFRFTRGPHALVKGETPFGTYGIILTINRYRRMPAAITQTVKKLEYIQHYI